MVKEHGLGRRSLDAGGFTLVEFLIAMTITVVVLSGVMALAAQLQQAYTREQDSAEAEQEARFAIDSIARVIRSAGSNPYNVTFACNGDSYAAIRVDPDGDGVQNDIRVQADVRGATVAAGPDGKIVNTNAACDDATDEPNEDVTIAYDAVNKTITRFDLARDDAAVAMTEPIITGLTFSYLKADHATATTDPDLITYVTISVTARSQGIGGRSTASTELSDDNYFTTTVSEEVRLRTRG
jgi:Tfp pilus assembly protein PilW